MGYLDYAGLQYLWGKLKEKFAPKSHSHDERYYTESEMDGKLNSKVNNNEAGADSLLSKLTTSWTTTPTDNTYFIRQDTGGGNEFGRVKFSTLWNYIKGKADSVYQPKGNYAASNHSHTKDQVGLGNVDNTADKNKSVASANFAKETYINQRKPVNLTDLDQNTWYPVTGTYIPYNGFRHFKCSVQLNSGSKPSWSTHSAGFTAIVDILEEASGWGTTTMQGMVLVNDQYWINDSNNPPVGYQQLRSASIPVWWLRGGGIYFLAADYDCTWTIQKSKYENSGQSVAPTTTYPGVNVNRSTITANLNGHANTAEVATVGVRDYNNANNTIKIGWSGADLDANTLSYVAGYTSDMKIHTASKDGVRSWLGLGASAYKKVQSLSTVGHSDWKNQSTDDGFVPTMAFMTFWNGAFNGSGNSNLQYCDRGRFGTIVTKNSGDYAVAGHTHSFDSITGKPSTYTPSAHTHDDRYYTETEMNAKLDGKSNTGHTHDDRYYTESEINTKLDEKSNANHTHNSIKDAGDGGTLTLAYSKSGLDYGSYSWLAGWNGKELRAVNKNQFATAYHTHDTSSISAGNANYAGYAGPIESAHIDVLRANRLAFLPASGIKVEYSVDGGATWIDYGATDDQKASLFAMRMGSATPFYTGKHTKAAECTTKDQLRITVTPVDRYASVNMLYLWVSVAGTSATVNISRSTIGAKETFTDVRTDVPISGWSGPNEIRFSQGTFGGGSTQTSNQYAYRFTFKNKADGKGSVRVMDIRMYGPSAWSVPNSMMEKDHIYNWDANQNVQFPAQVTATKFNGSSTGVVDYGNAAGATIKIGFNGAGLTKDKLTHIAGYAKDGNQTVIKDVDRGVLQSWLNLNEMINTQLTTGSSTPSDNDFYISQYAGGGTTTTTYHRRPISALWNYIKSKADAVYSAKSHTHTKSQITDFPASLKNPTALTIQTNGTTAAIYDGSAAKTVNITKSNIGLGNVDNTADANKSVKYATSAGNASKVNNHTVNIDVPVNAKFTDTTYGVATASSNGLMSSTDKTKLDDFSRVISIQKQIKLTTDWQDTGIAGNNLETGTYVVQVSGFNWSYTSLYSEIYSGIMSWYSDATNSGNSSEIFLHNAGHADNNNAIYLRTLRTGGNNSLKLQIACKVAATGTDSLTFKFRRLI